MANGNSTSIDAGKPPRSSTKSATLLERVSAADAARLEAIHSRMMALAKNSDGDATREVSGFVYEILQMTVVDKVRLYDPDKDYISDLFLELGQADAIIDLLYMVAAGKAVDSMDGIRPDTLTNSLYIDLEHLHAVKVAAELILVEGRPVGLKQEVAHV